MSADTLVRNAGTMQVSIQHQDAVSPAAGRPDDGGDAFAVLGLDPAADADLAGFAYRHLIATCQRTLLEGPAQETRLAELNRARLLVSNALQAGQCAAVGVARGRTPYQVLCVHPAADQELITIAYRHLLRTAAAGDDLDALEALERAYGRIGTAAARAAYDERARLTGTSRPAKAPSSPEPPLPTAGRPRELLTSVSGAAGALGAGLRRFLGWSEHLASVRGVQPHRIRPEARWGPEHEGPVPERYIHPRGRPVGTLRVVEGEREVVMLALRDGSVYTIGSGPHCEVRIPAPARAGDGQVGAAHAQVTVGRTRTLFHHIAEDGVSLVNGEQTLWAVLEPGDELAIGPYRCVYNAAERGDPAPPTETTGSAEEGGWRERAVGTGA